LLLEARESSAMNSIEKGNTRNFMTSVWCGKPTEQQTTRGVSPSWKSPTGHPNDSWGLEGPLQSIPESDLGIKPQGGSEPGRKSGRKPLPAVLDGMDKAEALAYVSRLFDAAQAGAAVWGDALLIKRFITQCSRTDSEATRAAYRFEIKEFCRWRERNHPHLHLREINPVFCQDWLDAAYGSEEIDQKDLLFQQVGRLERIARKAENPGQFSAAVGAITALNRMMALGADQRGFRGHRHNGHHYRR
jgi:hypothetical protein